MTMTLIQTTTVTTAGVTAIAFTGIPQTFTDLMFLVSTRHTTSAPDATLRINGATTNLTNRRIYGDGTNATSDASTSIRFLTNPSTATANTFANSSIYIPNYSSSIHKSVLADSVNETNATAAFTLMQMGIYANNAAITDVSIEGGTFVVGSSASLYGITKGSDGIVTTTP
jgi:hypothetical protein